MADHLGRRGLLHHVSRQCLRIAGHLRDIQNRPGGDAHRFQPVHPVFRRIGDEIAGQRLDQLAQVLHPVLGLDKARIVGQLRRTQKLRQLAPQSLIGGTDIDPAVLGLESLIGRHQRMGRAHGLRHLAGAEINRRLPIGVHDPGLEQGRIHVLAFAGFLALHQRRQNAHGRQTAGGDISYRRADFDRRAARALPGDAHQPAHPLRHQIKAALLRIRAGAAIAGDGTIDQLRVLRFHLVIRSAVMIHGAQAIVFDKHVRAEDQLFQRRLALIGFHVEADAPLVAVHHGERRGDIIDKRRELADIIAAGNAFHLDHICAHVRQHQPAGGRRHNVAHFNDPEVGQKGVVAAHAHLPLNWGGSLARNARTPSWKSSVS